MTRISRVRSGWERLEWRMNNVGKRQSGSVRPEKVRGRCGNHIKTESRKRVK